MIRLPRGIIHLVTMLLILLASSALVVFSQRTAERTDISGVYLGQSKQEVLALLGTPSEDANSVLSFLGTDRGTLFVGFNKDGEVNDVHAYRLADRQEGYMNTAFVELRHGSGTLKYGDSVACADGVLGEPDRVVKTSLEELLYYNSHYAIVSVVAGRVVAVRLKLSAR